eukprot:PhF_6_TR17052/c1_g2_i4/m.25996
MKTYLTVIIIAFFISPSQQLCDTLQTFKVSLRPTYTIFKPFASYVFRTPSPTDAVGGFQVNITCTSSPPNGIRMSAPGCPEVGTPSPLKCTFSNTIGDVHNALRSVVVQIPDSVMKPGA